MKTHSPRLTAMLDCWTAADARLVAVMRHAVCATPQHMQSSETYTPASSSVTPAPPSPLLTSRLLADVRDSGGVPHIRVSLLLQLGQVQATDQGLTTWPTPGACLAHGAQDLQLTMTDEVHAVRHLAGSNQLLPAGGTHSFHRHTRGAGE